MFNLNRTNYHLSEDSSVKIYCIFSQTNVHLITIDSNKNNHHLLKEGKEDPLQKALERTLNII